MTDHQGITRPREEADPRSPVYLGAALGLLFGLAFLSQLLGGPMLGAIVGALIGGGLGASWRDAVRGRPESAQARAPSGRGRGSTSQQLPPDDRI